MFAVSDDDRKSLVLKLTTAAQDYCDRLFISSPLVCVF